MGGMPGRPYRLRSRLRAVLAVFVALVFVAGAGTVTTAVVARRAMLEAHQLESTSRRAALLSVIAREQYIHEAHTIIVRDRSHVGHHDEWVDKLRRELRELGSNVDARSAARLSAIAKASDELKNLFASEILPAVDRKDWETVRRAHDRANELVDRMTHEADALAAYFDQRATRAERDADGVLRVTVALALALGLLAAGMAALAARSSWSAFSRPLEEVERVALAVAGGDRSARVAPVRAMELAVVAGAFNQMLDALQRAESGMLAAERLATVGRIAAGVAHEINNPIAVIRGYLKTMLEDARDPALREELAILDEEAGACQRIAEDLLAYARQPELAPRPTEIRELLVEVAERVDGSRRADNTAAPTVVVEAEEATIEVDPLRIRQVIVNLVANAREAAGGDGPVEVRGSRSDGGYRIEVLDRGRGIPKEAEEHLFEPFFTTRRDGTGLGLSVCYGLVTAHGGTIRAEPREEGGTRFSIDLPAVLVDEGRGVA
jgi:two-component system, NtrC family, sensor kinase